MFPGNISAEDGRNTAADNEMLDEAPAVSLTAFPLSGSHVANAVRYKMIQEAAGCGPDVLDAGKFIKTNVL